jgi:hypothetical protein
MKITLLISHSLPIWEMLDPDPHIGNNEYRSVVIAIKSKVAVMP